MMNPDGLPATVSPGAESGFPARISTSLIRADVVHTIPHLEDFLALREAVNTRLAYRREVVEFTFFTRCKDPRDVTLADCIAYFDSHKRFARSTQNRRRSVIRNWFAYLRDIDYLPHPSPMRLVKDLKRAYNPSRRRFLRRGEILKLLRAVEDRRTMLGARDFAIVRLMLSTGLRVTEVCELRLGDHSVEGGRHWLTVNGKGGYIRRVLVSGETWAAIEAYLKKRGGDSRRTPGDHLFTRQPGRGPQPKDTADKRISRATLHHRVRRLAESVGLEGVHLHSLRHTFAVSARLAGMDMYSIMRALGHSSIATTAMYQHLVEDEEDNAFVAVDRFIRGTLKATRKTARSGSGR